MVIKRCSLLVLFTRASAFTHPAGPAKQILRTRCRPIRTSLPVQSNVTEDVFVGESDATAENGEDERLLRLVDFLKLPTKNADVSRGDGSDDGLPRQLVTTNKGKAAAPGTGTPGKSMSIFDSAVATRNETAPVVVTEAEGAAEGLPALTGDGLLWRGVVVLLCALWASNFACAKVVLAQPGVDASLYAVARFSLAFLSLVPGSLAAARAGAISRDTARGALACGLWVAFGYLGQTVGLLTTTPSRACVICSLNCIFVAVVAEWARVRATQKRGYVTAFEPRKLVPALIAVVGVAIIELRGAAGDPTIGDLISFAQPVGFGMGYLQLEELMTREPGAALPVSAIKLAVVSASSLLYFELARGGGLEMPDFTPIMSSPVALGAIAYTGLVTTSAALYVESIAFARVPATDASIILTTEPLFAAAVSAFLVGETFGAADAIGAFFIVGACIYAIRMGEAEEVCEEETMKCEVEKL